MENNTPATSKSVLMELGTATRDITQLVALTRITGQALENLQKGRVRQKPSPIPPCFPTGPEAG